MNLGYQPNRAARRLRANSSDILGLIIPDIQNPFFLSMVRGVEDMAYLHGMNVILCNTDDNPDRQEVYLARAPGGASRRAAGGADASERRPFAGVGARGGDACRPPRPRNRGPRSGYREGR